MLAGGRVRHPTRGPHLHWVWYCRPVIGVFVQQFSEDTSEAFSNGSHEDQD